MFGKYWIIVFVFCFSYAETFEEFQQRCNDIGSVEYKSEKEAQNKLANSLYGVFINNSISQVIKEDIVNGKESLSSHIRDYRSNRSKAFLYIKFETNHTAKIICNRQQYEKYIQYINNSIDQVQVHNSPTKYKLWQNQSFDSIDIQAYNEQKYNSNRVKNFQEAKKYCQNLNLDARKWRLPTILEIYDITNHNPSYNTNNQKVYIKKSFINNLPTTEDIKFWLQDTDEIKDNAYYIDFSTNQIVTSNKDDYLYVMCISNKGVNDE